jgi:PRTRC genetic system protein A
MWGNYSKPKPKVDKNKRLALQKMMVGHYIETIPEDCKKKIAYVLQGDGLWERRVCKLGTFDFRVAEAQVPGLDETLEEGWSLSVPKIPINLLGTTVSFFRRIYKKHSSEVFLQFYYDEEKEEYVLHCPKQVVSGASVKYENDPEYDSKILVFEIHSHGNMGASFSCVDDADEKSDRFYGVIGNITNFFPDIVLRLVVGGREYEVEVEDLFDTDDELYHTESFPADWLEKIKQKKAKRSRKRRMSRGNRPYTFPGQVSMFGNDDEDTMEEEIAKIFDDEHLGHSMYFAPEEEEDEEDEEGFYIKDDDKLWFVKDGDKKWYVKDGRRFGAAEPISYDPTDHRGKKF